MSKYSDNMPPKIRDAIGWMYGELKPNKTLLDVGCSTGYFGQYIAEHKHAIVDGIELSDDRHQAAKVLHKVFSFDLDGEWLPAIKKNKYDYIFLGDVIEHLKDPAHTLTNIRNLLNPGGKVFISTPNIAHISIRLELLAGNFEYESMGILDNTHLKYFTLRSLKNLVAETGYTLESVGYSVNDFPPSVITKLLNEAGLKATDKFWKIVDSREARTFQYKLILSESTKKTEPTYIDMPEKPEKLRDGIITDLKGQVDDLRGHAEKQAEIIKQFALEIEQLKNTSALKRMARKLVQSTRRLLNSGTRNHKG